MYIRLDVFAGLLRVRPGELLHAVRTTGELDGMPLPARRQVRGAALMFYHAEATEFAARWHSGRPSAGISDCAASRCPSPSGLKGSCCLSRRRSAGLSAPCAVKRIKLNEPDFSHTHYFAVPHPRIRTTHLAENPP